MSGPDRLLASLLMDVLLKVTGYVTMIPQSRTVRPPLRAPRVLSVAKSHNPSELTKPQILVRVIAMQRQMEHQHRNQRRGRNCMIAIIPRQSDVVTRTQLFLRIIQDHIRPVPTQTAIYLGICAGTKNIVSMPHAQQLTQGTLTCRIVTRVRLRESEEF